ncbi:hypothetical protein LCGC14_0895170 [marine sediment metagenome]|uniref:Uncharacterized protein n=1 Tax=marine sediment metagenome TaxID=412755 RepID=A0A0F9PIV0_9ZZZZ|nr:MAG: hypothetical protein Lokiarch_42970 [Candidatus Lokiarchaeum sp. GC14_75]
MGLISRASWIWDLYCKEIKKNFSTNLLNHSKTNINKIIFSLILYSAKNQNNTKTDR